MLFFFKTLFIFIVNLFGIDTNLIFSDSESKINIQDCNKTTPVIDNTINTNTSFEENTNTSFEENTSTNQNPKDSRWKKIAIGVGSVALVIIACYYSYKSGFSHGASTNANTSLNEFMNSQNINASNISNSSSSASSSSNMSSSSDGTTSGNVLEGMTNPMADYLFKIFKLIQRESTQEIIVCQNQNHEELLKQIRKIVNFSFKVIRSSKNDSSTPDSGRFSEE